MHKHDVHQEIYFSVTILAFVSATTTAIVDPGAFPTPFATAVVKYYGGLAIAALILFYLTFTTHEDELPEKLIRRYQKTIRRMLFLTAFFLVIVMKPDLFGENIVSDVVTHVVITATLLYNTSSSVLLALSPLIQRTKWARFDLIKHSMEHEEQLRHHFSKKKENSEN